MKNRKTERGYSEGKGGNYEQISKRKESEDKII
jgi:hypothetical protein